MRKFAALGGTSVLVLSLATIVPAAVGPVPPAAATPIPTCSAPAISGTTATVTCPVGVDDTWTRRHDLARALAHRPPGLPSVLLAHDPVLFDPSPELGSAPNL